MESNTKPAMEVRDVHFAYGKNKVLKGVSLRIEEGKITTIMGANGCGKSTLFALMTNELYPKKGRIFLKGKNIHNLTLKEFARKVAIVQQYNSASDDITVEKLVSYGRTPHRKMMQEAARRMRRRSDGHLRSQDLPNTVTVRWRDSREDSDRECG